VSTSIKAKLFAAASTYGALTALLGTNPFRWYDTQLQQGTAFPAVVVRLISNPRSYVTAGRMPSSFGRVEFKVYGAGNDSQNADLVISNGLLPFLDTFNASAQPLGGANYVEGDRDFGIAQTQPMTYLRVVDARIYDDGNL